MLTLFPTLCFISLCVPAIAQAPAVTVDNCAMQVGDDGRIAVSVDGKAVIQIGICSWYGDWVYLSEGRAVVTQKTSVEGEVRTVMQAPVPGGEAPPMNWELVARPLDNGYEVDYQLSKSGEIALKRGVLAHFSFLREALDGHRVLLAPTQNGKLPAVLTGTGTKLGVELEPGVFLTAEPSRPHAVEFRSGDDYAEARMQLTSADFEPGDVQQETVIYRIERIDSPLPGEIPGLEQPLELRGASANTKAVPLYTKLELTVDLGATYGNPFDPDQVALDAEFTTPSGARENVPGFFTIDHERRVTRADDGSGTEIMAPSAGRWCVRYAPRELGEYRYVLKLRDGTGMVEGAGGAFEAIEGAEHGFIRAAVEDPQFLQFDDGSPFIPIGHNLPGYHSEGQLAEDALRKMSAAGENYNRWWMYSYELGIEWGRELGYYRQVSAARLDYALDLASELGMYYMLCFDTHQDFLGEETWDRWPQNPYSASLGGPCTTPAEWFTNEIARDAYKKRLRYIVARWGYSPNVLAWEFGNEFEGWPGQQMDALKAWHIEMGEELRRIDPFRHLITTSFWSQTGPAEIWELPQIDLVQTHFYFNTDDGIAQPIAQFCREQHSRYQKPHIFGEFGIRSHESTADRDPEGWGLHNAYWAALASFCNGTPMPWWHENYIDPLDLYFHSTSIARFVEGLDPPREGFTPIEVESLSYADGRPMPRADLILRPARTFARPEENRFVVRPEPGLSLPGLNALLQGRGHTDLRNPPTFVVDYPEDGEFIVRVGRVSNSGRLLVYIDDALANEWDLPCGEGIGKDSLYQERWDLWESVYDEDFSVPLSAGQHEIRVENTGADWIDVSSYTFTHQLPPGTQELLILGMAGRDTSIVWVQNPMSTWYHHARDQVAPVDATAITLTGLPDGRCQIERWDTWLGELAETRTAEVIDGKLQLDLPEIASDLALKIRHGM